MSIDKVHDSFKEATNKTTKENVNSRGITETGNGFVITIETVIEQKQKGQNRAEILNSTNDIIKVERLIIWSLY